MDLREAEAGAKEVQSTLATVLSFVGIVAGALGLAAVVYEYFAAAPQQPVFTATDKAGCTTCLQPVHRRAL